MWEKPDRVNKCPECGEEGSMRDTTIDSKVVRHAVICVECGHTAVYGRRESHERKRDIR
jgi:transcription elongation factor Elf1